MDLKTLLLAWMHRRFEACCALRDESASYARCRRAPHKNVYIRTFSSDMFLNKHSGLASVGARDRVNPEDLLEQEFERTAARSRIHTQHLQIQIAMATSDATNPSPQPPHRMICGDGSVYEITDVFARYSDDLCMRQIMPVQRKLSKGDLENDPVLLQFYKSFERRLQAMKRELPETDYPWYFYYESVLDGYRYKWMQDNKDQTVQTYRSEFGVAVASAAAASSE